MPTAFVTGGTGFVGYNLIALLRGAGWNVVAAHRAASGTALLQPLGVDLREADLLDAAAMRHAMPERVDVVFHLAANTSTWSYRNAEQTRINVDGTRSVVEAAIAQRARRFVHTASIATYGTAAYRERIDEGTPSDAATHWVNYVRTKWLAEQIVREAAQGGLDAVILNPANIVGPHDTHNWSRFFRLVATGVLPGAPPGVGTWCDVGAIVRAHVAAAERGRSGENYLLGGVDASYPEVAALVARLTGQKPARKIPAIALRTLARANELIARLTRREPDITPEEAFFACGTGSVDSGKAEHELGFQPMPLRQMVEDTLTWMRSAGVIPDVEASPAGRR